MTKFSVFVSGSQHVSYTSEICRHIEDSAKLRGTGIAKRPESYIQSKIEQGKAIICLTDENRFAGYRIWIGSVANFHTVDQPI